MIIVDRYTDEMIEHFGGKKELKLMSVGCGDGQVDLVIIEKLKAASHFEKIHVTLIGKLNLYLISCRF